MYRGNGRGGFVTGTGETIGSGWGGFTALVAPGDFSGDGKPDILARQSDGALLLYRGNGDSGFAGAAQVDRQRLAGLHRAAGARRLERRRQGRRARARDPTAGCCCTAATARPAGSPAAAEPIGTGWGGFTALTANGDFSGDGSPTSSPARPTARLLLYRGNGSGGFIAPYPQVGSGWQSLQLHHARSARAASRRRAAPAPAPPSAPLADGRVRLNAGDHCVPPGGRLHVSLKIRKRKGHKRPKVLRVVFFVRKGPRRVDRKRPYAARLRLRRPAGSKGRVYARVFFRRSGTKKVRKKTVARRYVMCG